jgi:large exoprotein involved in heme utilization and adhesion
LDIGGSFIASTANSVNFADGTKFSATPSQDLPLLTITAPLGLNMGSNPGPIQVQGPGHDINYEDIVKAVEPEFAQARPPVDTSFTGLQVKEGQTLGLVGGNVSLEGGILKSPSGRIEIGSVGSNGTVSFVPIQQGLLLGYNAPSFGDIQFSQKTFVSTTGVGGGPIAMTGRNISLTGESIVQSDTLGDRNGGEISVVGENIGINGSNIRANTYSSGNGGQIKLLASNITFENQNAVSTQASGTGDGGQVNLVADNITFNDTGVGSATWGTGKGGQVNLVANNNITMKNFTFVVTETWDTADAGNINIRANSFSLLETSGLVTKTERNSTGKAGDINIQVAGPIVVKDSAILSDTVTDNAGKVNISANSLQTDSSAVFSRTAKPGKVGEINLQVADSLEVRGTGIDTVTFGSGGAGKINISANSFLLEGSGINAYTNENSQGNAGDINIRVGDSFVIKNSGILADTFKSNAGNISISANSLLMENSGVFSRTVNTGKAGDINIQVAGSFVTKGTGITTASNGVGGTGKINIYANSLLIDDSTIRSARGANATGKAGDININVADRIVLESSSRIQNPANYSSINTETDGTGDAGDLTLNARTLLVQDGSQVATSALGSGKAGEITLNADTISLSGAKSGVYNTLGSTSAPVINVEYDDKGYPKVRIEPRPQTILPNAQGNSGNINISARLLSVTDGAQLTTSTYGKGNAGTINVNTVNSVFSGADTNGSSNGAFSAVGNAGAIQITTNELAVNNGARLVASSFGEGNAGTITIQASDKVSVNGDSRNSSPTGIFAESITGRGGDIGLEIGNLLLLRSRGLISARSGVEGQDGIDGNIDINTKFVIAFPLENSDIIATGFGRSPGSNIRVNAQGIFGTQFRQQLTPESDIVATGTVTLNTPDVDQTLGFVELPIALTDTSELIAGTSCGAIASTDSDTQKSSFTITGRGGLPPSPYEPLSSDVLWSDNRIPNIASQQRSEKPSTKPPTTDDAVKIVPATGWVFDGKGNVTLISHASNANNLGSTRACQKK